MRAGGRFGGSLVQGFEAGASCKARAGFSRHSPCFELVEKFEAREQWVSEVASTMEVKLFNQNAIFFKKKLDGFLRGMALAESGGAGVHFNAARFISKVHVA